MVRAVHDPCECRPSRIHGAFPSATGSNLIVYG